MQHGILATVTEPETADNNNGREQVDLHNAYQRHQQRRGAIKLSKLLIKLVLEMQKHRGCTLAILSGDHFFAAQLHSIQREITTLFKQIQQHEASKHLQDDLQGLLKEWILLRQHWPKDAPHENFLHHSNLIARINHFIWQACGENISGDLAPSSVNLSRFFLKDWLDMIETCAQARGLATHSAVLGSLSDEIHSRIRFLSTQMQARNAGLMDLIATLDEHHAEQLRTRMAHTDYQTHLQTFIQAIEDGLSQRWLNDADWLYRLGSQCVSACQQVLWCALQLLETSLPMALAGWVQGQECQHTQSKPSSTILPIAVPSSSV